MDEKTKTGAPAPEQIAEWKAKYGKVYKLSADDEGLTLYFRRPSREAFERFAGTLGKPYKALKTLIFDTLLYPDAEYLNSLFTDEPGLVIAIGNQLQEAVGTSRDFTKSEL